MPAPVDVLTSLYVPMPVFEPTPASKIHGVVVRPSARTSGGPIHKAARCGHPLWCLFCRAALCGHSAVVHIRLGARVEIDVAAQLLLETRAMHQAWPLGVAASGGGAKVVQTLLGTRAQIVVHAGG